MQDIIVIIIGIVVFGIVGLNIFKTLTRKPSANNTCGGCTGCALKEKMACTDKTVNV